MASPDTLKLILDRDFTGRQKRRGKAENLAMIEWVVAGEMGSGAAQNNLPYLLVREIGVHVLSRKGRLRPRPL